MYIQILVFLSLSNIFIILLKSIIVKFKYILYSYLLLLGTSYVFTSFISK